jgi:hypothetical protein
MNLTLNAMVKMCGDSAILSAILSQMTMDERYRDLRNRLLLERQWLGSLTVLPRFAGMEEPKLAEIGLYLEDAERLLRHLYHSSTNEKTRLGYLDEVQQLVARAIDARERLGRLYPDCVEALQPPE